MKNTPRIVPQTAERVSLLAALIVVVVIAILSYRSWTKFGQLSAELAITEQVAAGTNALLSDLKDAETGQRGFLLTGRDEYLEPYRQAVKDVPVALGNLAAATEARAGQFQQLEQIRPRVAEKLAELRQTIELYGTEGPEAARAVVLSDHGKLVMDQIRQLCAEMQAVAYRRLEQQSQEAHASGDQIGLIGVAGSIGLFVLLTISTITIRRATDRRQRLITALQASEQQTKEARDLLQTTIGSIGDGVIATDGAGRITLLNAVAQTLTGWTEKEAAGQPLDQVFAISNEETGATVESPVTKALREGRVVGLANHTNLTSKDGRVIPIDDSAAPIRDGSGRVIGVVLVFRDVIQRRAAERLERQVAAAVAKHAEVLAQANADLQQFAYAASHDLREPLRTINAYSRLLERRAGSQLDEQNGLYLQFISAAAVRMAQLVDALLEYSRAGEVAERPLVAVPMEATLATALANLQGAIQESHAEVTHDPLPVILGDELHLVQLVQNLIGNALKYRSDRTPRIHIQAKQAARNWTFSVSDNGIGIAAENHLMIFELFKRLHGSEASGAGIGLATCKKIVERYGGKIWVESEEGNGSTFFFSLPAN